MYDKNTHCTMLKSFMAFQLEIIEEHIESYKYFRGIKDTNEAIVRFAEEYGWLLREIHCKKVCPNNCDVWEETIKYGNLKHKEVCDEKRIVNL